MFDANDSAKGVGGGYRCRVEVLTGPGRRRRWSPEEKVRAVLESLAPEAVVSSVARRWGVLPQQLFAWRREAREGLLGEGMRAALGEPAHAASVPLLPDFVPLVATSAMVPASSTAVLGAVIEVELSGAVVRIPARGADSGVMASVLRAVRASALPPGPAAA